MNDESFWLSTCGDYAANPPLAGDATVDVAIVGAGFTGLSTAYHLRGADSGIRVAVLESEIVGFGPSGRNAGFSTTNFGLEPVMTMALFGHQRTAEAHRYMERAVGCVDSLVREHGIECDYSFPGFLRVATVPAHLRRIRRDLEILASAGVRGIEWLDAAALRAEVDSPHFLGGLWEPRAALLNPAKLVRGLKRIAEAAGAAIYERTPVTSLSTGTRLTLHTPSGTVRAEKVVLATNAYSHLIPQLRPRQTPAFTHMTVTEPLTDGRLAAIGWRREQGIENMRNLVHYIRLTPERRLAIGGSDVSIAFGRNMNRDANARVFGELERAASRFFPALKGVRFTHRWGGPVSITADMVPALGELCDERVLYAVGCMGHGVPLAHLNGRTLADLAMERKTDLTDVWFVNRRVLPWPPEPLRFAAGHAVRAYMRVADRFHERNLRPAAESTRLMPDRPATS